MVEVIYLKSVPTPKQIKEIQDEECHKFSNWLREAFSGETYCYYVGDHVVGSKVARKAFEAYEKKLVLLFQKKDGTKYKYLAQKR